MSYAVLPAALVSDFDAAHHLANDPPRASTYRAALARAGGDAERVPLPVRVARDALIRRTLARDPELWTEDGDPTAAHLALILECCYSPASKCRLLDWLDWHDAQQTIQPT